MVMELFKQYEKRDPAELLPAKLPDPIEYRSQRDFVRKVLREEVDLRARGTQFIPKSEEPKDALSVRYREQMNSEGSPSEIVSAGWLWVPGGELTRDVPRHTPTQEKKSA
jgi:hypothetical protein